MKVRIVQAGFETFSGLLGDMKFEGGVSTKDVSAEQLAYIRAMFVIEEFEEAEELPSEEQDQGETPPEGADLPSGEQNPEVAE